MIQSGRTAHAKDGAIRYRVALTGPLAVLMLVLMAAMMPAGAHAAGCTTTLSSTSAAASAVSSAAPGSVVCLADGSYGRLSLNASKSAPGVTVQAADPGAATIAGATMAGSYITLAQFRVQGGSVDVQPASTGMTIDHNLMVGNRTDYAVYVCPGTTTVRCNDVSITNNKIQGSFDEDQIQANLYHDGPDADPYGLLVEGNEFLGNVEWGNHDDVFQSVWGGDNLYFRKNYLHDFGGQGFFVKDQPSTIDGLVFDDNLIVRQNLPCDPTLLCPTWQLAAVQIFGPVKNVSIRHNTVWPGSGGGQSWLRGSGWAGPTAFSDNVFANLNSDASGLTTGYAAANNTYCGGSGMPSAGLTSDCNPAFGDATGNDLRQANGRGVDWRVADQQYGPGAGTTTPPDTTAPDTTIGSGPGGPTNDATPAFGFTSTEAGSAFTCRVDAGIWAACISPWTTAALADGGHSVTVRARDAAGNTDASPATRSFTVDTAAPHTTIMSQPGALSLSGSGSVGFTVSDSAAASQCRLDNGAWSACSSPYQVSALGAGRHQLDVRSDDAAGNVESPGASAAWTVVLPLTPPAAAAPAGPTVTLAAPAADATVGRTARFAADAMSGRPISRVEFWLDSRRVAADKRVPYVAMVDLTSVRNGMHTVTARAFDSTGQAASTAVLVRVSRTAGGRMRAAAVSSGGRATKLSSAAAGAGATQLAGQGPGHRMLAVTLTRCDDRKGNVVDRARLRADDHGQLSATRARAGLCVLSLSRPS